MVTQTTLPFQYKAEKNTSGLTGFAGLPLYVELAIKSGLMERIENTLQTKSQGWRDTEMILSLVLLNLAGGDCITDINRLEQDNGLRCLLRQAATYRMSRQEKRIYEARWRQKKTRSCPSTAAIHRYLAQFHTASEEEKRVPGEAFIPATNAKLAGLIDLNAALITAIQAHDPCTEATLDQDATLVETEKRNACYSYKKYKAYQPFNTYWAEHGVLLHSEFRDGNVNAGKGQLRLLKTALDLLPSAVSHVSIRSDTAGYQTELLAYCAEGKNPRFGVIDFGIGIRVSAPFRTAVQALPESAWQPLTHEDAEGERIETSQEWAEVCFVPSWAGHHKHQATYRYIGIREVMKADKKGEDNPTEDLPFQTYQTPKGRCKLFGLVTNRTAPGNDIINWHRARCGKSEQVHHTQKSGLAGGQLPSNKFGANAAWWQIMVLAYNLNRLMQVAALPTSLKESQMKALRFHFIQLPGRVICHARRLWVRLEKSVYDLFCRIRARIAALATAPPGVLDTT